MNPFVAIERKESQLEELISLAEDVSGKIDSLSENRNSFVLNVSLTIAISVIAIFIILQYSLMLKLTTNSLDVIFTTLIVFGIIITVFSIRKLNAAYKLNEEIENERFILGDLLNMIDSYKATQLNNSDAVKKAYFEMRLSRIAFGRAKFKNKKEATKKQLKPQPHNI